MPRYRIVRDPDEEHERGAHRRTLLLGLLTAVALALAAASPTDLLALSWLGVIVVGGGLFVRRPLDVGAIGLGGVVGVAGSGAVQLGQAGGPKSVLELVVGAVVLGVATGLLAGGVALIRSGFIWLARERGAGKPAPGGPAPAPDPQLPAGARHLSRWQSGWFGLLSWFALGVYSAVTMILSLTSHPGGHSAIYYGGLLFSAFVLVAAPFLAIAGWGAAALSLWRGTSTSESVDLATSASAAVAGIVAGAALGFAVGRWL